MQLVETEYRENKENVLNILPQTICGVRKYDSKQTELIRATNLENTKNILDNDGQTELIRATNLEDIETIKLLLKNDANINEKDNDGWSALIYATYLGIH